MSREFESTYLSMRKLSAKSSPVRFQQRILWSGYQIKPESTRPNQVMGLLALLILLDCLSLLLLTGWNIYGTRRPPLSLRIFSGRSLAKRSWWALTWWNEESLPSHVKGVEEWRMIPTSSSLVHSLQASGNLLLLRGVKLCLFPLSQNSSSKETI